MNNKKKSKHFFSDYQVEKICNMIEEIVPYITVVAVLFILMFAAIFAKSIGIN